MRGMRRAIACAALLGVLVFVAGALGYQVFGGRYGVSDGELASRTGFHWLWTSFVAVFQVLTTENWVSIMDDAVLLTSWPAVLFFVAVLLLGRCTCAPAACVACVRARSCLIAHGTAAVVLLFNLLVGMIIEQFSRRQTEYRHERLAEVCLRHLEQQVVGSDAYSPPSEDIPGASFDFPSTPDADARKTARLSIGQSSSGKQVRCRMNTCVRARVCVRSLCARHRVTDTVRTCSVRVRRTGWRKRRRRRPCLSVARRTRTTRVRCSSWRARTAFGARLLRWSIIGLSAS